MTTITIERAILDRLIDAWDSTVLPKSRDGMMQERMEDLRAALAAPESGAMAEIDYTDDDALRFIQRVLESDAPGADKKAARDMVVEIRTRVLKARASKPATAPDRHAQELLAQDITLQNMAERHAQAMTTITIERELLEQAAALLNPDRSPSALFHQRRDCAEAVHAALAAPDRHAQELLAQDITIANMRERHAQELCAYSVTVDKLRAERKPMTPKQIYQICPELCNDEAIVEFARRIELHHGIGDKP